MLDTIIQKNQEQTKTISGRELQALYDDGFRWIVFHQNALQITQAQIESFLLQTSCTNIEEEKNFCCVLFLNPIDLGSKRYVSDMSTILRTELYVSKGCCLNAQFSIVYWIPTKKFRCVESCKVSFNCFKNKIVDQKDLHTVKSRELHCKTSSTSCHRSKFCCVSQ